MFLKKPLQWLKKGVEPTETMKQNGFKMGDKLPAEYVNEFLNRTYEAIDELQENTATAVQAANAELSRKVDRTYLDMIVASLADGGPRELFYSVATLQSTYPNGEIGTYLVFDSAFTDGAHTFMWNGSIWEDLGVYQARKLEVQSVQREHININTPPSVLRGINLQVVGDNLINPQDCQRGGYYNLNGIYVHDTRYGTTDYFSVEPNTQYRTVTGSVSSQITLYDERYNFITSVEPVDQVFTTTADARIKYARSAITLHGTHQIENTAIYVGTDVKNPEYKYRYTLNDKFEYKGNVDITQINGINGSLSVNKFNLADSVSGGYFDAQTGEFVPSTAHNSTGFIPVAAGQKWYKHGRSGHVIFRDAHQNYVAGIQINDTKWITVPNIVDIAYMQMSYPVNVANEVMIVLTDSEPSEYIPYDDTPIIVDQKIKTALKETVTYDDIDSRLQKVINRSENGFIDQILFTNQYGDISIQEGRDKKYGTSYWLLRINRETFDGQTIIPKVKITAPSVTSGATTDVRTFVNNNNYLAVINAGVFNVSTSITDGLLIVDGQILKNDALVLHPNLYALGIKNDGTLVSYAPDKTADFIKNDGCISAVVGFVPIIENYQVVSDSILNLASHANHDNPRQVIGQLANGDYIVCTFDGRASGESGMTLRECAEVLQEYNVKFAYNLDGGGSTQTFVNKKRINRLIENRRVPNVIVFERA